MVVTSCSWEELSLLMKCALRSIVHVYNALIQFEACQCPGWEDPTQRHSIPSGTGQVKHEPFYWHVAEGSIVCFS